MSSLVLAIGGMQTFITEFYDSYIETERKVTGEMCRIGDSN